MDQPVVPPAGPAIGDHRRPKYRVTILEQAGRHDLQGCRGHTGDDRRSRVGADPSRIRRDLSPCFRRRRLLRPAMLAGNARSPTIWTSTIPATRGGKSPDARRSSCRAARSSSGMAPPTAPGAGAMLREHLEPMTKAPPPLAEPLHWLILMPSTRLLPRSGAGHPDGTAWRIVSSMVTGSVPSNPSIVIPRLSPTSTMSMPACSWRCRRVVVAGQHRDRLAGRDLDEEGGEGDLLAIAHVNAPCGCWAEPPRDERPRAPVRVHLWSVRSCSWWVKLKLTSAT